MADSGRPTERLNKRTMVEVSHAIERAALAAAEDGPLVVVAMFQRAPYFERERAVYGRIAAQSVTTVIGLVADQPPAVPDGAYPVRLAATEELAREWTVVALTPRFGAMLVAHDREEVAPASTTLEGGRLFDGRWHFRRDDALHELVRLRRALADRLPPPALAGIDDTLTRVRDLPATPGESRTEAAVRLLVSRIGRNLDRQDDLCRQLDAARRPAAESGLTGLADEAAVRRWTGMDGTTASGTLPVALVGIRVAEPPEAPERLGRRSAARELQAVLQVLTAGLRPIDRVTRFGEGDFLLIMPALSAEDALQVAYRIGKDLGGLAGTYPFVQFSGTCVVAVTRRRPLPVDQIRRALDWAVAQGVPVAALPPESDTTPA
ncbi:DICT sensory domain-containing protein [Plantactinospora sp. KBS50]|uniref:DICT sensory domain-containing protein n=1 Tax=Plantactinospora sp. KBS50 TaxID=2024580 RepID=UPI001E37DD17|nr:DICT sensory domain-containing protein [Plantactinospora sp. KBS50]